MAGKTLCIAIVDHIIIARGGGGERSRRSIHSVADFMRVRDSSD
jgi:hypothetical protein